MKGKSENKPGKYRTMDSKDGKYNRELDLGKWGCLVFAGWTKRGASRVEQLKDEMESEGLEITRQNISNSSFWRKEDTDHPIVEKDLLVRFLDILSKQLILPAFLDWAQWISFSSKQFYM